MNLRKTRSQTAAALSQSLQSVPSDCGASNAPHIVAPPVDPALMETCQQMLSLLRVAELQKILSFVNISFAGRKQDLQARILNLLNKNFELISGKIKDVYAQSIELHQVNNILSEMEETYSSNDEIKSKHSDAETMSSLTPPVRHIKTPAERAREYRLRLKHKTLQNTVGLQNDIEPKPVEKSKADRQREYRLRKKLNGNFNTEFAEMIPRAESQSAQYGPTEPKRMYSHMQIPVQPNTGAGLVNSGVPQQPVISSHVQRNPADVTAGMPGSNPFLHTLPAPMPLSPDVRLKKLAFYDVLGTLIKPSSLLPRNTQRIQEASFYFTLTPQQATDIAMNRDIRNAAKAEYSIQVQLRFCLMETSCEQDDCFPPSVTVKINNKICQLPNVIPTNRPNVEPKRPPRPVNVTSNVKLSPTVTNTIIVQWCPDYTRGYCLAVYLVKKLTSAQLLHRMRTKGIKPADYTRALIKEKLTEDADCEIATTMLKVSLNCPLGKMKMSIPCRASTCSHLQCFDANLFLQMNEKKPTWNCPVCDKPAVYDTLVIDGYFQEVLASPLLKNDDTEIQLHKDGSWSTHTLRNESQFVDTPTKPAERVEIVSDDMEIIEDVKPTKMSAATTPSQDQPTSTTNSETVDLTLSDSDDDLPLAKRRPAQTTAIKPNTSSSAAINSTAGAPNSNLNDLNNTMTISLDSPSPPASPVPSNNSRCDVTSTVDTPKSHLVRYPSTDCKR